MKSFKNFLLKATADALRSLIPVRTSKERRFLVVTTTALGDTLWATPALESLRKSFPAAFIGVMTSLLGIEVLKNNPHIDRLYLAKEPIFPRLVKLWRLLFQEKFDTVLIFHASQRLIFPLCSLLGAQKIVGTKGINKGLDSMFTDLLETTYEHEIVRRLKIVESVGGKIHTEKLSFFLTPEEKLEKKKGLWIAIHPGATDSYKCWSVDNFVAAAKKLQMHLPCEILVTGSARESKLVQKTAEKIPKANILTPPPTLREFAALLEQVDLLICNDTGPFHLACAMGVPTIGLYAPTDAILCGPHLAKQAVVIQKRRTCTPCLKRKCPLPFCLYQISVDEVVKRALQLLPYANSKNLCPSFE